MKKKTLYLVIIILISAKVFSQNRVILKEQYKADSKYTSSTKNESVTEVTFIASEDFIAKLKSNGIDNPTTKKNVTKTTSVVKTGKISNNSFPITDCIVEADDSMILGSIMYGEIKMPYKVIFDSMVAPNLDADTRLFLLKFKNDSYTIPKFTNKELSVGDTFMINQPLSIPIGKNTVDFLTTTIYTLLVIDNNNAFFEYKELYTMITSVENKDLLVTGSGDGQMTYNHKEQQKTYDKKNMRLEFIIPADTYKLKLVTVSTNTEEVVIE